MAAWIRNFSSTYCIITGEVDDENDIHEDRDWNEYWRILFKKVSVEDIMEFEEKYKGKHFVIFIVQLVFVWCFLSRVPS